MYLPARSLPVILLLAGWAQFWVLSPLMADPDDSGNPGPEPISASGWVSGTLHPGVDETIRFGVVGDFGISGTTLAGISSMIRGWNPDFVVTTGDNTYGDLDSSIDHDPGLPGNQNDWEFNVGAYFGDFMLGRVDGRFPLQTAEKQRFFPTVGNHDSAPDANNGGTIDDYLEYFHANPGGIPRLPIDRGAVHHAEVSFYAVRQGPVDLFILDGDVPTRPDLIAAQKSWLATQAAHSTARWKLAIFHQPPLTSGSRGAASWMAWEELRLVDAILCGHDHFYERLDYFGTPLFITGAGGQFLYSFRSPPDPASLTRYNAHHSAMLITADAFSLRLESRALELPARQETLVEAITLGTPSPIDNDDTYSFFAEAGEIISLRTTTPAPLSQPPLDPELLLTTPGGPAVTPDQLDSPDGRNVRLTHQATQSGRWTVKISASPPGRGAYTLQLSILSPLPDYPTWSSPLPAGLQAPDADADRDGTLNLMEYALQIPPDTAAGAAVPGPWQDLRVDYRPADAAIVLTFDLPSPLPPGVSYQIDGAPDPAGPWQVLAWRPLALDWQDVAAKCHRPMLGRS